MSHIKFQKSHAKSHLPDGRLWQNKMQNSSTEVFLLQFECEIYSSGSHVEGLGTQLACTILESSRGRAYLEKVGYWRVDLEGFRPTPLHPSGFFCFLFLRGVRIWGIWAGYYHFYPWWHLLKPGTPINLSSFGSFLVRHLVTVKGKVCTTLTNMITSN